MQTMTSNSPELIEQQLIQILQQQKQAYQLYPMPSAKDRIERLNRLKAILVKYQDQFAEAISQILAIAHLAKPVSAKFSPALNRFAITANI
jgi:hypothetical protein